MALLQTHCQAGECLTNIGRGGWSGRTGRGGSPTAGVFFSMIGGCVGGDGVFNFFAFCYVALVSFATICYFVIAENHRRKIDSRVR